MRHKKKNIKLGREKAPRIALLRGLAENLILHGSMKTTKAKAKAVKTVVEPLVTKAKKNRPVDLQNIGRVLYTGNDVNKLVKEIAPLYADRRGGYTRIIKIGPRAKESADIVKIEFV